MGRCRHASGKSDVLAVQTLRNSVMASSFMASTAILLLIGALTMSASSDQALEPVAWPQRERGDERSDHYDQIDLPRAGLLHRVLLLSRWRCASTTMSAT
jgi:hypothetical protein